MICANYLINMRPKANHYNSIIVVACLCPLSN
jgi:hypothetical protein